MKTTHKTNFSHEVCVSKFLWKREDEEWESKMDGREGDTLKHVHDAIFYFAKSSRKNQNLFLT